jgi:CelD/BcsL family acetyltransferase involved in cellulose biosynthesis
MTSGGAPSDALDLRLIERVEELDGIAEAWRALHAACAPASPFLSFDWMRIWAQRFCRGPRRLHVVALRQAGRLVALAPWCRVAAPHRFAADRIEFLGTAVTAADHLDVLAEPAAVRPAATRLYAHLFGPGAPRWQRLELRGFAGGSAFLLHLARELDEAGRVFCVEAGGYCPTVGLQGGGGEGLAGLLARRRKRQRYQLSVLAREGTVEHVTRRSGEPEAAAAFEAFAALYRARWGAQAEDVIGFTRQLVAEAGERPRVEIDLLEVAGRAVAGLLHLRSGEATHLHLMAVDRTLDPRLSVGNLIVGFALERAAKEGLARYDFLRGGEDYKLRWADGAARDLDLIAHRRSLAGWLALAGARLRELAKLAVR